MPQAREALDEDVETIVIEAFQNRLDVSDDLSLTVRLYDLGLDSITLVVTLLDIGDQLQLNLKAARVDLNRIETLEDVISLFHLLRASANDRLAQ